MELKKLDLSFYTDNPKIKEALDYDSRTETWDKIKVRGHGIVKITINDLVFAIPVRSNVSHSASYILEKDKVRRAIKGMGLDYSKALLIRDAKHITNDNFVLRSKDAGKKLIGKEEHITNKFQRYVERYIAAIKKGDNHVLSSVEYRYTTLINYHTELGI